ncbi:helix-turn-helix domain-containing protein [Flavobacterium litorale]|uniref:AraC family transcriptional regulator n=1 Tax=Flavobacterium litorale TaxID=2856519 RepID=A0ABX8V5Z4_9FLAO|nr:AraC family transcriptional regulator [Flavobacterium litorale]QYJ68250.1 AraC family transcriptional regulator [Flavobacterium litorale]
MKICKVSSLPLKDVIKNLASCLNVEYKENCNEYYLDIPAFIGEGQIRGVNFDNGLGIIIYKCKFNKDVRVDFSVNDVHPIKYIYSVEGPVEHSFSNESTVHLIEQYKCAIVASERNNGHVLSFPKDKKVEIVSLEIDRRKFLVNTTCELGDSTSKLQKLFKDIDAAETFYHDGFYGIEFKNLLQDISKYENQKLIRKFYLESMGLQIFVKQLEQFEDDLLNNNDRSILRVNELNRVEDISIYIKENPTEDLSIVSLSRITGLNPSKLQTGFKHLFNTTVNEYVTNTRLEKALVLLKQSDLNVSDVASGVGFSSNSYFSKIFKKKYKMSPTDYKKI